MFVFFGNFFVYALLFSQNSKTTILLKKIAEIPYFFLHSGTPQLALARYPKKFVFIISRKWDLRGSLKNFFKIFIGPASGTCEVPFRNFLMSRKWDLRGTFFFFFKIFKIIKYLFF